MLAGTCSPLPTRSHTTEFGSCYYFYPTITLINIFGLWGKLVGPELPGHRKQGEKGSPAGADSSVTSPLCSLIKQGVKWDLSGVGEPVKCVPCCVFLCVDVVTLLCSFYSCWAGVDQRQGQPGLEVPAAQVKHPCCGVPMRRLFPTQRWQGSAKAGQDAEEDWTTGAP